MILTPVTATEVQSAILALNNTTSCDAEGIQIKLFKFIINMIAPVLTHIFNLCFNSEIFPEKMQLAKVRALYKKGSRNYLGNYRPVSVLPVFSKGLEKLIFIRLSKFLDKSNTLSDAQYGFRPHRSTQFALLDQKEHMIRSIDSRKFVLGIFIDFTKAFDYLNSKRLIKKLEFYGIRGKPLQLIKS